MTKLLMIVGLGLLISTSANAQCANCPAIGVTTNGWVVYNQSSDPEPSVDKLARKNLEILRDKTATRVKELESKWFNSGTDLSNARDNLKIYNQLLKGMPND